ncbi:MAG: hypothetical protein IKH84_05950 [Ottowia sp.]|nr:hypothetical protein [Ottowia sp.]
MKNPFAQLLEHFAPAPVQIGTVQRSTGGICYVTLPGGATIRARGEAQQGTQVFVQGGNIQGQAPALPVVTGEV